MQRILNSRIISRFGFGCHRLGEKSIPALKHALVHGINLVDVSPAFGSSFGRAEILVGAQIRKLPSLSHITIVTKAITTISKTRYSIDTDFIDKQLKSSILRLDIPINVYLLDISHPALGLHIYTEIEKAFIYLEKQVEQGQIESYGLSSTKFSLKGGADSLNLHSLIKLKSSFPHFNAIQFPLNLFESESIGFIDILRHSGIFCMTNRPLNCITSKGITSLSKDSSNHPLDIVRTCNNAIIDGISSMVAFETQIISQLTQLDLPNGIDGRYKFKWSDVLSESISRLTVNPFNTELYFKRDFVPEFELEMNNFRDWIQVELEIYKDSMDIGSFDETLLRESLESYTRSFMRTLELVVASARINMEIEISEINQYICGKSTGLQESKGVASNALLTVSMLNPGGCTLVGMRTVDYVDSCMNISRGSKVVDLEELRDVLKSRIFD